MGIVIKGTDYNVRHAKDTNGKNATEITIEKNGKKAKIKIFAGSDNTYNADDKIVIKGDADIANANQSFVLGILKELNGKNNHDELPEDLKRPTETKTFNPFNLNPENIQEPQTFKSLLSELDGTAQKERENADIKTDADSLKAMGINEERAEYIEKFFNDSNYEDTDKELIKKALKKLLTGTSQDNAEKITAQICQFITTIKQNSPNKNEVDDAIEFIKRKIDGTTFESDQKAIVDKLNATLTQSNIQYFLENFSEIFDELYDDCKDDKDVIRRSCRKIFDVLTQHVDVKTGNIKDLHRKAENAIKKLEKREEGFWGPDNDEAKAACDAMKAFRDEAIKIVNSKRAEKIKKDKEELEKLIK